MNQARCPREGCTKNPRSGYDYCAVSCRVADDEMAKAERICREGHPGSAELWSAAVAFNDALTALRKEFASVYKQSGMTKEQWRELAWRAA